MFEQSHVLDIGGKCNNSCWSCMSRGSEQKSLEHIRSELLAVKYKQLLVVGGEPTLHADFWAIMQLLEHHEATTITNGRAFSYAKAAKQISSLSSRLIIKLFGHTAALHDSLTCTDGSFNQTMHGMKNLWSFGKQFGVLITVTAQNYSFLQDMVGLAVGQGANCCLLALPAPMGRCRLHFGQVCPRYTDAAHYIEKAAAARIKVYVCDMPTCLLKETKDHGVSFAQAKKTKIGQCSGCNACDGIYPEYLKRFGDGEFKDITR